MTVKYIQTKSTALTYGISSSSTTMQFKNLLKLDGTSMSASDIGDLLYGTFAPGTSREEIFSIVGANVTVESDGKITITSVSRGLKEVSPYNTGGYSCDHPAGEVIIFGNNPQVYQWLKDYMDAAIIAGSVPATDAVPGIVIEGTQAQVDAGTTQETYNAQNYDLFVRPDTLRAKKYHDAVASATGTDAYAITVVPAITAYTTNQEFTFIADVANTGACTLNVCGLGAINIKKDVSSDPVTGDIIAGQVVKVVYNGTNMQMVSQLGNSRDASLLTGAVPAASLTNVQIFPAQDIPLFKGTGSFINFSMAKAFGSDVYVAIYALSGSSLTISRMVKDAITGNFYITHQTTLTGLDSVNGGEGVCIVGSYVYVTGIISATYAYRRYDLSNLGNVTTMTYVGTPAGGLMWTDNTYIYVPVVTNQFKKLTISGTTLTDTINIEYTGSGDHRSATSDGTYLYQSTGTTTITTISKYPIAGGAAISTLSTYIPTDVYEGSDSGGAGRPTFFMAGNGVLGIGWGYNTITVAANNGIMAHLMAITAF